MILLFPEFKLDASSFIKTLNQIFDAFKGNKNVSCSILLKLVSTLKLMKKIFINKC